ncbi:adenylate/guanylate cyclase domain-containing protein [Methylobacterium sp. SyP6R]|uniref:adenylate/guanylate cyclase domain-containing protein n=1 Tax=Methylobacterium sp. SyP6R TaxID=2718876 RepID=UPI001F24DD03|nr:adenylate/guanylate cyclase domain-containing protein [Methylobacterium sp. SyP6R]MCF4127716.1 adenylate/guanylate cyclase domain-containing protein [Methylobacterium sp. SyP6R]
MIEDHDSGGEPPSGLRDALMRWLLHDAVDERFLDDVFAGFCDRLRRHGVAVAHATLHLRTNHPQWLGIEILWRTGCRAPRSRNLDYGLFGTEGFRGSPAARIMAGAAMVRQRRGETGNEAHPEVAGLMAVEGLTDFVAWPLRYTLGKRHMAAFASDRPGGFIPAEVELLAELLPALAVVTEVRHKNRLTRLLLDTYVGPHAGEMILNGATRRGSGVTVEAAIMVVDLRGFTRISELWPRDDVIALLNDYFDAVCCPVERNGGEILKFIGDGLLAIFPLDGPDVGGATLRAAGQARLAMRDLNAARDAAGQEPLGYGIGVHAGAVMYGNIGSRTRLDFTIIGPAVNVAARLEGLTKELDTDVLVSGAFAALPGVSSSLTCLGRFPLRGVGKKLAVYALAGGK